MEKGLTIQEDIIVLEEVIREQEKLIQNQQKEIELLKRTILKQKETNSDLIKGNAILKKKIKNLEYEKLDIEYPLGYNPYQE